MRPLVIAGCFCLFAAATAAALQPPVIEPIFPNRFAVGNGERWLGLHGSGLSAPNGATTVVYSGAVGTFELEPSTLSYTSLQAWIPLDVVHHPGVYSVRVRVTSGTSVAESNAQTLEMIGPAPESILHLPQSSIVQQASGRAGARVSFEVSASSSVDGSPLPVDCDHRSGDVYSIGSTTIRCSTKDVTGTVSGLFGIIVVDFAGPVIHVPADITAQTNDPDGAVVEYRVTADDQVDGTVQAQCTPASGSRFPRGTTTVQCEASDAHLNRSRAQFDVTVVEGHHAHPILHLPAPITVDASGAAGAVVTFTVTAEPASATVVCAPSSGSLFPIGMTTVACTATDETGDSAAGSFVVTVVDGAAPIVTSIRATPDVLSPPNHKLVPVEITVTAVDDVDPQPLSRVVGVTANESLDGSDWRITGALTLELRAERTGQSQERVYLIHVETTDSAGNSARSVVTVRVPHDNKDSAPAVEVPPSRRRSTRH